MVIKEFKVLMTESFHYAFAVRCLMVFYSFLCCLAILGQARTRVSAKKGLIKHCGYEVEFSGILLGLPEKSVKKFGCNMSTSFGFLLPSQDVIIEDC